MELKPGVRLRSVVCDTEAIVVTGAGEVDVRCGGLPMVSVEAAPSTDDVPVPGMDTGTLVGKRYTSESGSLELLCTKAGKGTLAIGATPLDLKQAKPLPSSD
jgi:hypothetical protein